MFEFAFLLPNFHGAAIGVEGEAVGSNEVIHYRFPVEGILTGAVAGGGNDEVGGTTGEAAVDEIIGEFPNGRRREGHVGPEGDVGVDRRGDSTVGVAEGGGLGMKNT